MIPRHPRRRLRLRPGILDRNAIQGVHSRLIQRGAVQIPFLPRARSGRDPQLLHRPLDALPLAVQVGLALLALLAAEEQPGAVDGPVPQVAVAAHAQGRRDALRGEDGHVLEHVDDLGVALGLGALFAALALLLLLVGLAAATFLVFGARRGEEGAGCGEGAAGGEA